MKEFDSNGIYLAQYMGNLFIESLNENYSTPIFIRRFIHSNLLKRINKQNSSLIDPEPKFGIEEINEEFGKINYGKIKYSKEEMFWIGYFYEYVAYTREVELSFLFRIFDYEKIRNNYYSFHTQDLEWALKSFLEMFDYNENIFNKNWRLKQVILKNLSFKVSNTNNQNRRTA